MTRRTQGGELCAATVVCSPESTCPPAGRYLALAFASSETNVRFFLTEGQAAALAGWLKPPTPATKKHPTTGRRYEVGRSPVLFPVTSIEWEIGETKQENASDSSQQPGRQNPFASTAQAADVTESGDKLLTSRFINGFRQRCESRTTAELDRELAVYEPDLARAVNRTIRATVAGHLSRGIAGTNAAAEACHREVVTFLLAMKGVYGDLLSNLITDGSDDVEDVDGSEPT